MRLTHADRELVAEHVRQLEALADTHRQFAAMRADRSGCSQTKTDALVAARKAERLAAILRAAMRPEALAA